MSRFSSQFSAYRLPLSRSAGQACPWYLLTVPEDDGQKFHNKANARVLSQSLILGQNPKIGHQKFNDLQAPKLSKKQLCDRTRASSIPNAGMHGARLWERGRDMGGFLAPRKRAPLSGLMV